MKKADRNIYTRKGIPAYVVKGLQEKLGFESLSELRGRLFTRVLNLINETVKAALKGNEAYMRYIHAREHDGLFIDAKSLRRYFNNEPIRQDKLYVLLCFLGYPADTFEEERRIEKQTAHERLYGYFEGEWFSYVYDIKGKVVKRTVLFMRFLNKQLLDVQYEGLQGRFKGTAQITDNSIHFDITNAKRDIRFFFRAEISELIKGGAKGKLLLNVSSLSNSIPGTTITSNVIMAKTDEGIDAGKPLQITSFLSKTPVTLRIRDKRKKDDKEKNETLPQNEEYATEVEEGIIYYLFRNKNRNERIESFDYHSWEGLRTKNLSESREAGQSNFERLKIKLRDRRYIGFNRFRQNISEVAIFHYRFEFLEYEKRILVYRHALSNAERNDFEGEAFLEGEKIYFILRDQEGLRRKQFIAPFNTPSDDNNTYVLKGITSSVSILNGTPIALRELIVGLVPNLYFEKFVEFKEENISAVETENSYLTYDNFIKLPQEILKEKEKLFIANQSMSILTFPSNSDTSFTYYRIDKARKYASQYNLMSFSLSGEPLFLKAELEIDSLSEVTFRFANISTESSMVFRGVCEFFNNSLRIGVHYSSLYPTDERHAELMFDPIVHRSRTSPTMLTGMCLTTDEDNRVLSFAFLAVVKEWAESEGSKINDIVNADGKVDTSDFSDDDLMFVESYLKLRKNPC